MSTHLSKNSNVWYCVAGGVAAGALGGLAAGWYARKKSVGCRWSNKKVDTGLKEFSVIYTDRAVNMLSKPFTEAMQHISKTLKHVYSAEAVALIPGSGTYAMEAVARQFGTQKKILILRNGYFSFRWTDIVDCTQLTRDATVVMAAAGSEESAFPKYAPLPVNKIVEMIKRTKPHVVFAPHVETSTGIILPDEYVKAIADAAHSVNAIFVLDCVASGTIWIDMKKTGVDVVISAPQKGWTGPACCGLVMMSERARSLVMNDAKQPPQNSFCCNLRRWSEVMASYEKGVPKYYTTLPTDALMMWTDVLKETESFGFARSKERLSELGKKIRNVLESNGFPSVASDAYKAPGVVVSYSPTVKNMCQRFKEVGLQVAGGVPFKLGEKVNARELCFRIGLFGLDKNKNVDATVRTFEDALRKIVASAAEEKKGADDGGL